MKKYRVHYDGGECGGRAIVIANNEDQAETLVRDDRRTTNFENVVVVSLGKLNQGSVIFNWDGDPGTMPRDE